MHIREYEPADLDSLRRIHGEQSFHYPFPNLADPIFVSKLVVEDKSGSVVMASLARLTCEIYLLMDHNVGSAQDRYFALKLLRSEGEKDLFARGLEDAHAWLPPIVAKRFGRRLEALGWVKDAEWIPYSRRLSGT